MNDSISKDFLQTIQIALIDSEIKSIDFRILSYIALKSDFLLKDMKEELSISSFNTLSKSLKNLLKNGYIVKQNKNVKSEKNISSYQYLVTVKNKQLLKSDNSFVNSPLSSASELYCYFFEKIPSKTKVSKSTNLKSIFLMLENYQEILIRNIIDFISENEELKKKYNRPILLRKNIQELISLTRINKGA
ncbi:hypothetical protein AFAEC_1119 [Aliarcobacter faecis]|uniref:hypothetical protein n=2 Tax=Aliarcobacter faecis TaxID=1564138 RepID=UPI00047DC3B7|nr:hypothetical protein [Aliarcobacter faecis]QKF73285.1 hypothetical protein AFAEC_1119 [Aliarcobacter faecis]